MSLTLTAEAPPLTVLDDGAVRVTGTRLPLEILIEAYLRDGSSAEQLAEEFAPVPLADVYAVLAYFHRHRAEVMAYLAWVDEKVEAMKQKLVELRGPQPTRAELLARRTFPTGHRVPASGVWACLESGELITLASRDRFPPCREGTAGTYSYRPDPVTGR